jgi:hypothetical protein
VERKKVQKKIRAEIIVRIYDTKKEFSRKLFDKFAKHTRMQYLQRCQKEFNISPEEMVERLKKFIDDEHTGSLPSHTSATGNDGWARGRSGAAPLAQRVLEVGLNLLYSGRQKWEQEVWRLSGELDKLQTTMAADNEYRDACIKYWKDNDGYWSE